ncbi:hypothetical protein BOTBODRAFT_455825 [Botryobasidium botryosum FD-172 SS1]|uniref:Uncharacterized protein n=1 Tax=Botryobasidium botryosum (strain FD-172 SS1) TaxID=930990 RepID=A0A067M9T2_BOTB1|nr:hypothetical protein BOTBODRAFT_455825 [Botryobasidium botryosum FD-172 SS1]
MFYYVFSTPLPTPLSLPPTRTSDPPMFHCLLFFSFSSFFFFCFSPSLRIYKYYVSVHVTPQSSLFSLSSTPLFTLSPSVCHLRRRSFLAPLIQDLLLLLRFSPSLFFRLLYPPHRITVYTTLYTLHFLSLLHTASAFLLSSLPCITFVRRLVRYRLALLSVPPNDAAAVVFSRADIYAR